MKALNHFLAQMELERLLSFTLDRLDTFLSDDTQRRTTFTFNVHYVTVDKDTNLVTVLPEFFFEIPEESLDIASFSEAIKHKISHQNQDISS